jgi:PPK2 family polyphosphate:nucleotide phosphotransferase
MLARRLDKSSEINLNKIGTSQDGGMSREQGEERLAELSAELFDLQEMVYAAGTHALLVVLQGRDTSGKDGTLKAVAGAMNPVGVRVASFKVPTGAELAHDFLWRVHAQAPGKGEAVFFNRSHYEDVLVVRVHKLAPEAVWKARYDHINAFEGLLTDSNVILLKFFLHISKGEQEERLRDREQDPEKAWKLSAGDWEERKLWDDYTKAYEDALSRCATPDAPWFIVPSDKKWFRNVAVAEVVADALRAHKAEWKRTLDAMGRDRRTALAAVRSER